MVSWQSLVQLPVAELARLDIAAVNLACAEGFPGAVAIDWERHRRTLDSWADSCGRFTRGMMPHFRAGRCDYANSEPRFRMQVMVTHLQRDLGVRYHPDRISEDADFQPEDSFLYGVMDGEEGTCGNMPLLYASIGRRLDYPIMLAGTRQHQYCRWDGGIAGMEAFNIEASGHGISFFPDEYYRTGRYAIPPETAAACGYGRSLNPREELASFLCQRGICLSKMQHHADAVIAFAWANELDPHRQQHAYSTHEAMRLWDEALKAHLPHSRYFPKLDLGLPAHHFRRMTREAERQLIGMAVTQRLLDDQALNCRWWQPLRQEPNKRPEGLPDKISADFRWQTPGRWVTISPHLTEG